MIRAIIVALLVILCVTTTLAQTDADKKYIDKLKNNIKSLKHDADESYKNVKRLDKIQLQDIDKETHKFKQDQLKELVNKQSNDSAVLINCEARLNQKRKEISRNKGDVMDKKIDDFVIKLLTSRCNPQAIATLKGCENLISSYDKREDIVHDIAILYNYENYCHEIREVLNSIHRDLKRSGWKRQEEGSDVLKKFDNAWNHIGYRDRFERGGKESISFLDERYNTIVEMRNCGFNNCASVFEKVMQDLIPDNKPLPSPTATINKLAQEIELLERNRANIAQRLDKMSREINDLKEFLGGNVEINNKNKAIIEQRKQAKADLTTKQERIDNVLNEACLYCLSQPCDSSGNNKWLRNQVTALTDTTRSDYPQLSKNKKRFAQFHELFNKYETYVKEVGDFWAEEVNELFDDNDKLVSQKKRVPIEAKMKNLNYYKHYYNKPVRSPNLDYVLTEIKKFLDGKKSNIDEYIDLGSRLRGKKSN